MLWCVTCVVSLGISVLSAMFASGAVLPCGARACTAVLCMALWWSWNIGGWILL